jgi:ubiquinone/menaquinone biosynthesis C-methylase UbiE
LLNWAARYFPILRALKQHGLLESGTILEIGSGPFGIGTFRKVPFTGCDLAFSNKPQWPMTQLIASAADLPVADGSFDVVLASDVLEHIPPVLREQVIREALRVASRMVIFGFPCGEAAHNADKALKETYLRRKIDVPVWLEEHMDAAFPDPSLFRNLQGWKVDQFSNESLQFHQWMMRREMNRNFVRITSRLARYFPWLVERWLRRADGEPSYRQIFLLTKQNI